MSADQRSVICIRHEDGDNLGIGEEVFSAKGVSLSYVDAWRDSMPELRDVGALIVLGGAMHADDVEGFPFVGAEQRLLKEAVRAQVPILGICLGAQLLARGHDAPVKRSPVKEFGFIPLRLTNAATDDLLLSVFSDGDRVMSWHEDIFDLPRDAVLLARSDQIPHQAYRLGRRAWGLQFHIEVTEELLNLWMDSYGDRLELHWGRSKQEVGIEIARDLSLQQGRARLLFERFLGALSHSR